MSDTRMTAQVAYQNIQTGMPQIIKLVEETINAGNVYVSKKYLETVTAKGFKAFYEKFKSKIKVEDVSRGFGNQGGKIEVAKSLVGGDETHQLVKLVRESDVLEKKIQDTLDQMHTAGQLTEKRKYTRGFIRGDKAGVSTDTPKDKRTAPKK